MEKKIKKTGILTFHNAHNYGAALQAYALRNKLRKMGYEAEIINYCNKSISKNYTKVLRPYFWKRDILPQNWGKVFREIKKCIYAQKAWQRQWAAFTDFKENILLEGKVKEISAAELEQREIDVFLLGSDQIWASELTRGLDPVYFGEFAKDKKKISYAASVPNGSIPERERELFRKKLRAIDCISVREEKLAETVRTLVDKPVTTVVDPTLLLEAEDYEALISKNIKTDKKYVFAYFVVENETLLRCAQAAAKTLGAELIELHYFEMPNQKGRHAIADIGPKEFLYYIKHAEMVLTNSFHGTVFSIIFEKKFYSVYKENNRITHLLEFLQIPKRHIIKESQIDVQAEIDYSDVEELLAKYRSESVAFLEEALKE